MRPAIVLAALALFGCDTAPALDADANTARKDFDAPRVGADEAEMAALWDEIDSLRTELRDARRELEDAHDALAKQQMHQVGVIAEIDREVELVSAEVGSVNAEIARVDGDVEELVTVAMDHGQTLSSLGDGVFVASQTAQSSYAAVQESASYIAGYGVAISELQADVDALSQQGPAGVAIADTEVYYGVAPTEWTGLDLSGIVGANAALVVLSLDDPSDMTDGRAMFRPAGSVAEFEPNSTGSARVRQQGTAFVTVTTDDEGQVEWISTFPGTDDISVSVVAYAK